MEPSLGIIAGCMATLRPLFKAWGFGPGSSPARDPSKSNGIVSSSVVWHPSRGMQKLNDKSTSRTWAKAKASQHPDASDSDIELVSSTYPNLIDPDTSVKSWEVDLEQGPVVPESCLGPRTAVHVQTSINITSRTQRAGSFNQGVALPAHTYLGQGQRKVMVNGRRPRAQP